MENKGLIFIQDQIGYKFKNPDLLEQAFTRRSYSQEYGGENNEVLEFIGDKVLDIVIVKYLAQTYGYFCHDCDDFDSQKDYDEFICEKDEGALSKIKQSLVCRKNLVACVEKLGLKKFLILGKGDESNQVREQDSVKEDLFEAIVGAVALDSDWDFNELQNVVTIMLCETLDNESEEENYIELIQEWSLKKFHEVPWYHYKKMSYTTSWYIPFDGITVLPEYMYSPEGGVLLSGDYSKMNYYCLMKLGDLPIFRGWGESKADARKCVCRGTYQYLEKNHLLFTIKDEIENPNRKDAINQLEILARRGYFSLPKYEFAEEHDDDGNPVWKCVCTIMELSKKMERKASKKTEAKRMAAYALLLEVLKESL